jgi:Tfp pilus assembly protein PilN
MKIKLNLIPQYKKDEIKKSKNLRKVLKLELEISGMLLIFFLALLGFNYALKANLSLVSDIFAQNENNPKYIEMEEYGTEIKEINRNVSDVEAIQEKQVYWSKLLLKLNEVVSPEITLSRFSNQDLLFSLVGKAKTREDLVAFKERLEAESCFSEVKLPLSNLVSKEDLDFQIDFNIKEECVREK